MLQSPSKLLGHLICYLLPSRCWCAKCGELTAINNIGRTRVRARSEKKKCWVEVSLLFLSETMLEKEFKEFEELFTDIPS